MKMIVTLFVVFAFASTSWATPLMCPNPPIVPTGGDIGKIAGQWYYIEQSAQGHPVNRSIIIGDFIPLEDGNFNCTATQTFPDGSKQSIHSLAKRTDNQNILNLYDLPHAKLYTYNIVDIDYDNYMAAYVCIDTQFGSVFGGPLILSRTDSLNTDKYNELSELLLNILIGLIDKVKPK